MRSIVRLGYLIIPLSLLCLAATAWGQPLFPKSSLVSQKCGACHKPDPQGKLEVIEETRKTPEEWVNVVERMIRLNGAVLDDADFFPVVKELSRDLCLTPKEMLQVAHINSDENSQFREVPKNKFEERLYAACVRCHTFGKIASHRMTKSQWKENRNLHLGYYPTTVPQMREMDWTRESKDLIEPLAETYAFDTAEYRVFLEKRKEQDLSGGWFTVGYQPGMGYYDGNYTFTANPEKGDDEYLVRKETRYRNGYTMVQMGTGTLYSEYHLRYALAPTPLTGRVEGVFDLNAGENEFKGKWWTVIQDSNSYGNERFFRSGSAAKVVAMVPGSLKAGTQTSVALLGVNFPGNITAADVTFSDAAISVQGVERVSENKIICSLDVGDGAAAGVATVSVKDVSGKRSVSVYKKIDRIKIFPTLGRARVSSGAAYPPQGVQFVAYAMSNGADGESDTADDMLLEPVDAKWWVEEEKTRETDDDLKYLGMPVENGLYTPVTTYGPIAERSQHREGVGLVAVGAAFTADGVEHKGRALLAVTVPDFIPNIK